MKSKFLENLIYLILLCLPTYLIRFNFFGVPFTFLEILILILFFIFLIKTKAKFSLGKYKYIIYSFILISLVACIISIDQIKALGIFKAYIIEPILFFIVFINIKPNFDKALKALGLSAVFISLVGIYQYFTGWGIPAPWNERGFNFRITSIYDYPNAIGLYLAPIIALFLGNIIKLKKNIYFSLIVISLSMAAILYAKTEGALLAVLIAFIFLGFFTKWKKLFIAGLILGIIILFSVPAFREIVTFQDTSGDVRLALWQGTFNLIKDRPLIGAGLASFPEIYAEYKLDRHVELLLYPHNIFLNFWVELGLAGFIWLVYVLIIFFKNLFKHKKNKLIIISSAVMVAILVYGLVDVVYFKNDLALMFWFILGLNEINHK